VFVSARVAKPGDVLAVPRDALRRLIATDASLSDKILAAFLARRAILMTGASSAIRVIGSRFSPDSGRVREFLARNRILHEWLDPDADRDVERLLREFDMAPGSGPPDPPHTGAVARRAATAEAGSVADGELLKLGIDVCQATVSKYLVRGHRPPSQTWRTFPRNHVGQIVAADFFVVPTATYRLVFVLVLLAHDRRRIRHVAVTAHPTAAWTAQPLRETFPWDEADREPDLRWAGAGPLAMQALVAASFLDVSASIEFLDITRSTGKPKLCRAAERGPRACRSGRAGTRARSPCP
jgi:hypothetical protein